MKGKQYDDAQKQYIDALAAMLGKGFTIPLPLSGGLKNEGYIALEGWEQVYVMECCNCMANCMIAKGDKVKVRIVYCRTRYDGSFNKRIRLWNGWKKLTSCGRTITINHQHHFGVRHICFFLLAQSN